MAALRGLHRRALSHRGQEFQELCRALFLESDRDPRYFGFLSLEPISNELANCRDR